MKLGNLLAICSIAGTVSLTCPSQGLAVGKLTMVPQGDGSFVLEGDDATGVTSVDLTVNFDATSLAAPRFSVQGGTVAAVTNANGEASIHVVREDPTDPGVVVYLDFDTMGNRAGIINFVTASMKNADGDTSPVPVEETALEELPGPAPAGMPQNEPPSPLPVASPGGAGEGELPKGHSPENAGPGREAVVSASREETPNPTGASIPPAESGADHLNRTVPLPGKGTVASKGASPPDGKELPPLQPSVLQRFERYTGKKGLNEFARLFAAGTGNGVRQEPAIALSDGTTPVRITFDLPAGAGISPHFTMTGGKVLRLYREDNRRWVVTAIPAKGTWNTRLVVRSAGKTRIYPLVVAPRVRFSREAMLRMIAGHFLDGLDKYISDLDDLRTGQDAPSPPRHLIDYLYTANYLARIPQDTQR